MDPSARLNALIDEHQPAAGRALSALGRRAYFPIDIPAQSSDARGCKINATIGEVTDGRGAPLALPIIAEHFQGLDPAQVFLYAPQGGQPALRQLWQERIRARAAVPVTLPLATAGITQGLSLVGDLFCDVGTDVLIPRPSWGNYKQVFGVRRGANIHTYPSSDERGLDLQGLSDALDAIGGKGLLLLNFPGNPTGYTPTVAEGEALVALLLRQPGPLVVVFDDAYQDMTWEPGLIPYSPFYALAGQATDRIATVKLDGATKELFFFGARLGFISFGGEGPGADALAEKAKGLLRSSVSSVNTVSQTLVRLALAHPEFHAQRAKVLAEIGARYRALKDALLSEDVPCWPFNSGFFALVPVPGDPDAMRRRLIAEASVGVVSFAEAGALRLSYGSIRLEDVLPLARAIKERL